MSQADSHNAANFLLSPELVILSAWITGQRRRKGNKWCETKGVGATRAVIDLGLPPENVITLCAPRTPEIERRLAAQREAKAIVATFCAACRGCRLGKSKTAIAPPLP